MTHGNMHHVDMTIDQMLGARPLPECAAYRTRSTGSISAGRGVIREAGSAVYPGTTPLRR